MDELFERFLHVNILFGASFKVRHVHPIRQFFCFVIGDLALMNFIGLSRD